jgi:transposase
VPAGGQSHGDEGPPQAANALRALLVTAPVELREQLRDLDPSKLAATAARLRPGAIVTPTAATKLALRTVAERQLALTAELTTLDAELDRVTARAAPALRELCGVGAEVAGALLVTAGGDPARLRSDAAFSMLCGASPIEASSGKTTRHRLNRGGDRQANTALYRIVVVRLRWHEPTRKYMARRTTQGLSKKEIIRCFIGRVSVLWPGAPGHGSSGGVRGRPRCFAARRPVSVLPPLALRGPGDRR